MSDKEKEIEKLMEDLDEAVAEHQMWEQETYRIKAKLELLGVSVD